MLAFFILVCAQVLISGQTTPGNSFSPLVVPSLDDALRITVPLLVHVENKVGGRPRPQDREATWYVCEILNDLGNAASVPMMAISPTSVVPPVPGTPALAKDTEIYVLNIGAGSGSRDPEYPMALQVGREYLLLVRFERDRFDVQVRVGMLPLGRKGIFLYDSASKTVQPVQQLGEDSFWQPILKKSSHISDLEPLLQTRVRH